MMKTENETITVKRNLSKLHDYQEDMISAMEEYWDAWYLSSSNEEEMRRLYHDLLCDDEGNINECLFSEDDWKVFSQCCNASNQLGSTVEESYMILQESILALEERPGFPKINLVTAMQEQRNKNNSSRPKSREERRKNNNKKKPDFSRKTKWHTWKKTMKFKHPNPDDDDSEGISMDTINTTEELYRQICGICQQIVWLTAAVVTESSEQTDEVLSTTNSEEDLSTPADDNDVDGDESILDHQDNAETYCLRRKQDEEEEEEEEKKQQKHNKRVSFANDCKRGQSFSSKNRGVRFCKQKNNLQQKWQTTSSRVLATVLPFWARFRNERSNLVSYFARNATQRIKKDSDDKDTDHDKYSSCNKNRTRSSRGQHHHGGGGAISCNNDDWTGWYQSAMFCR